MKNPKVIVLLLLLAAAFADGVTHQLTAPGEMFGGSDIVFTVVATLLTFMWYRFDSDQASYRRTPWLNIGVIGLAVIALPYYFFRSRGFGRGSVAVGLFLLCCAAYAVLQKAGEYAAYYGWQS
jgi:hypothetical protein